MKEKDFQLLKARVDKLDDVVHILQSTASCMYTPNDKEWNMLLIPRDKIEKHLDKVKNIYYNELEKRSNTHKR